MPIKQMMDNAPLMMKIKVTILTDKHVDRVRAFVELNRFNGHI